MTASEQSSADHSRGARFVKNVIWNWMGVGANLATGLIISPYLIRKLGAEAYGIWAISVALIEYYVFLDLGFRSATVKYVAHYWATKEPGKLNEVINTALTYVAIAAALIFAVAAGGAHYLNRFFQISPAYREDFVVLLTLITFGWCLGSVIQTFAACLEAVQRFDLYNHAIVVTVTLRAIGTGLLLYFGYGLVAIGAITVISQAIGYAMNLYNFRRVFPELRLGLKYSNIATLKKLGGFGIHTFLMTISNQILSQGPPVLIGHFWPARFVGFFQLPGRLLMYTVEAVARIGIITNSNTAELAAKGDRRLLAQMAVFTNRYCVMLFMPLAIVFWTWGDRFFRLWVPNVAAETAPLLPILLVGYMIAVVGQFSSNMMLQGLARHQRLARGMLVEAVAALVLLIAIIPRHGVMGAAWIVSSLMVANRGLFAPWLVSREMSFSFLWFLGSIYLRPALAAAPVLAMAYWLRASVLPGTTWLQFAIIGAIVAGSYYALAYLLCLPRAHQAMLSGWIRRKLRTGSR
jgi:O-antigen/teichoic acid export membrane protein